MTGKEKMLCALQGRVPAEVPVTPHWWGLYKFEHAGLIRGYDGEREAWGCSETTLESVDDRFIADFDPDMLHLTTLAQNDPPSPERNRELLALRAEAAKLESKAAIDRYMDAIARSTAQVLAGGELAHVARHSKKYGGSRLIALNEGSDTAWLFDTHVGVENALIGLLEQPENVQYYLKRLYDRTLQRMAAYRQLGGQAFINSETYCSADIMSPQMYRDIIWPVQYDFYTRLGALGILPICYFTGDIRPMLEDICRLPICGLMVEATKKNFVLDIGELADRIDNRVALFGNLESVYVLERGTPEEVRAETLRQLRATEGHRFIMANDCPVSFHTPAANIRAMLDAVRGR